MYPYEQGGLDGLCGIYSIVNSTKIVANLRSKDSQILFNNIIKYLEDNECSLSALIINGLTLPYIGGIFQRVVGDRIQRAMPFRQHPETSLDDFWTAMHEFLNTDERRCILIGLGGVYDC